LCPFAAPRLPHTVTLCPFAAPPTAARRRPPDGAVRATPPAAFTGGSAVHGPGDAIAER